MAATDTVTTEDRQSLLIRKAGRLGGRGWPAARMLLVAGCIAVPVGLVLMILGWIGAARTTETFQQLSYIASGCFIGLALVGLGGLLYFSYWQSVAIEEARAREGRLIDYQHELLDRVDQLTVAVLGELPPAPDGTATLVATENGTMVHRDGCPIVKNRAGIRTVTPAEAERLRPCRICRPPV